MSSRRFRTINKCKTTTDNKKTSYNVTINDKLFIIDNIQDFQLES